jgi:hypothetical protein
MSSNERLTGTVVTWRSEGYAFLAPDDGGNISFFIVKTSSALPVQWIKASVLPLPSVRAETAKRLRSVWR